MQHTSYTCIPLCQVITICAAYTPADNCSVGLRSWCNTYCLQPYTALFVFIFMAATLHSSFFKGFYYYTMLVAATAQIVLKSQTVLFLCTPTFPIFKFCVNCLYKLINTRRGHKLASIKVFVAMPHNN